MIRAGLHKPKINITIDENYKSVKNKLSKFMTSQLGIKDTTLDQLTFNYISKFKIYIEDKFKNHTNTSNREIIRIKTVINWAIKMDWIKDNPFKNYKGKTVPTIKSILNFEDIRLIEEYESNSEPKNIIKDMFLFTSRNPNRKSPDFSGLFHANLVQLF